MTYIIFFVVEGRRTSPLVPVVNLIQVHGQHFSDKREGIDKCTIWELIILMEA